MKVSGRKLETLEDCIELVDESLKYNNISHGGTGNNGVKLDEDDILKSFDKNIDEYIPGIQEILLRIIDKKTKQV